MTATLIKEKPISLSPKQEETVEVIAKLTTKFNYPPTLDEIAAAMGITKGTLQYHLTALRKKKVIDWKPGAARSLQIRDRYYAEKYFSKFKSPKNHFGFDSTGGLSQKKEFDTQEERCRIPILGKIAAGQPLSVYEETDEFLELDTYFPEGCYALKVKGESMIDALISNGDLVLIEPRNSPREGEIVVALIDNEAATLKRFFKEDDGRIRLQPENPMMKPIYIPKGQDLKIQGIVKGVIRKV